MQVTAQMEAFSLGQAGPQIGVTKPEVEPFMLVMKGGMTLLVQMTRSTGRAAWPRSSPTLRGSSRGVRPVPAQPDA